MFRATEGRWGSRDVEITDVAFVGRDQAPSFVFHSGRSDVDPTEGPRAPAGRPISCSASGLFNADGVCCYGTNTYAGGDGARTPHRRGRR